jgi:hypothetical protein
LPFCWYNLLNWLPTETRGVKVLLIFPWF